MRRKLSLILVILFVFISVVPAFGQEQILIRLPENRNEITTRNIKKIVFESINQMDGEKSFNMVLALTDYKGKIINYVATEKVLGEEEISKINAYTKILPEAYKVKAFAWDNLKDRNLISNIVDINIKGVEVEEEILRINEINVEITKGTKYELPKEVPAIMNNGLTKNVPVKWSVDSVDTTKSGRFAIKGNVVGYKEEEVILNLSINSIEEIESIEDIYITIDQGDWFELPNTVLATMTSGSKINIPVKWDVEIVDISTVGEFIFNGEVEGYENEVKLYLTIEELDSSQVVIFQNQEIEDILRDEIGKDDGDVLKSDLLEITDLSLAWSLWGDFNLEDLKHLKNLETLDISFLDYNFDLNPISNLIKLRELNLFGNTIDDISSLQRLTNLTSLNLATNDISNVDPLSNLTNLEELRLNGNRITDIKPLSNMINLETLMVGGNKINDYTPTAKYYSNLETKDFEVTFLQADDANTIKYNLNVDDEITLPYGVKLSNGEIVFVDWEKVEIVGLEEGTERIKGRIVGNQGEIFFECTVIEEDRVVVFPDENLEKAIRMAIDKNKGDIYYSDVKNLKELDAIARGIRDLTGIENLKGLEKLGLWANNIDSSQLRHLKSLDNLIFLDLALNKLTYIPANAFDNMTNLFELCLDENSITEIDEDAFTGLDNLVNLLIEENNISNIDSVRDLPKLEALFMRYNKISDISTVTSLSTLRDLWAGYNRISDITPLANLTELNWVKLDNNNITDISALSNSAKITRLNIGNNYIRNIDVVANMPNLEWFEAKDNEIENIDGVIDLIGLTILNLKNNRITNIEALRKLENLTQLYLAGNSITDYSPVASFYDKIKAKDFYLD